MEPFLPLKRGTFSTRLFRPQVVHFDRPLTESLQYLLVGGGEARLLVQRENRGLRAELAVME